MRLSKIRIAGFKSFVDPVSLEFRTNLTAILGPNGCGKSNTIDAVRWVMGESSAKHLRGASMDDVIFNGSSARKPIGVASVELVFDNHEGKLGGEYAAYSEIAIKRQVSRDGESKYFLNGSRCRRRDITDIFLGTGLGARSYAIIEQGMIARLIEAKPEELRTTLEEAAGISRYKERRRETESRMANTRENLARLNDVLDEITQQLEKLDKQAKTAQRFQQLREQERTLHATVLLLQWNASCTQCDTLTLEHQAAETRYQRATATLHSIETQLDTLRTQLSVAHTQHNQIQADYYQAGHTISRIEQALNHYQELQRRHYAQLTQLNHDIETTQEQITDDENALTTLLEAIDALTPTLHTHEHALQNATLALTEAEHALTTWQHTWQALQETLKAPLQHAQIEKTRITHAEQQLTALQKRQNHLEQTYHTITTELDTPSLPELTLTLDTAIETHALAAEALEHTNAHLSDLQRTQNTLEQSINALQTQYHTIKGRLASLETLQHAALNPNTTHDTAWLTQHNLHESPLLTECLTIESGWETAIETVLGQKISAHYVNELPHIHTSSTATLNIISSATTQHPLSSDSLAHKILHPNGIHTWLHGIRCIDSLTNAYAQRAQLKQHESFITPEGAWIGQNWLHIPTPNTTQDGPLQRQHHINGLKKEHTTLETQLSAQQAELTRTRQAVTHTETQRKTLQTQVNHAHRQESEARNHLNQQQQHQQYVQTRRQHIQHELETLQQEHQHAQNTLKHATTQHTQAVHTLDTLNQQQHALQTQQIQLQTTIQTQRHTVQHHQIAHQQTQLQLATLNTQHQTTAQQLQRTTQRLHTLNTQQHALQTQTIQAQPIAELQTELEHAISLRLQHESALQTAQHALTELETQQHTQEQHRQHAHQALEHARTTLEQHTLALHTARIHAHTLQQEFTETGYDAATLHIHHTTLEHYQETLHNTQKSIQRLGAINLAAIDEYTEQAERHRHLNEQHTDLTQALATLETAIRKIDKETRTRFKDTFDTVNQRLQTMFPRLFGGGECHLDMTGDDLLTTGVTIMARPPGKRITNIYLLSGGEKALTAVALVFAIFELNPAPFCMLDEVDAPLDEANVGRFCELVKDMSQHVQFIFITHNKTTMELAENLIGVTMREPGVSRLVAVDVAEAVRLANG